MKKKSSQSSDESRNNYDGKRKTYLLLALLVVIVVVVLLIKPDIVRIFTNVTVDYFEAKEQMAEQLSMALSKDLEKFRIAAINGPIYQPGSVVDPENPIDLLTDKCLLNHEMLKAAPWAPLPEVAFGNKVNVDISDSKIIQRFGADIVAIGGNIKKTQKGTYKLTDIQQILAPRRDFFNALAQGECVEAIGDSDVIVVRGQILAKETLSTSRGLGGGFKTKLIGAGRFKLQVNDKGDFRIEDKEPIPRFHIVTLITDLSRGGNIAESLKQPTEEHIKKLESID